MDIARETPITLEGGGVLTRAARNFLQRNDFYLISALLLIAGSYWLMRETPPSGGEFLHMAKALAILQVYELTLLLTAAAIVSRLFRLDDAFTLLVVELALLLDPTFFANSFFTLIQSDRATEAGVFVNAVCWALVPLKLLILQYFLRLRISLRGWLYFLGAAAAIYLAPYALALRDANAEQHHRYFLILWSMPLLALTMPLRSEALRFTSNGEFTTEAQRRWLPILFLAIPVPILILHFWESWFVHNLALFGVYFTPLFAAIAIWLIREDWSDRWRIYPIDFLAASSLLLSLPEARSDWLEVHNTPPEYLLGWFPMMLTGVVVASIYAGFYLYRHYLPALNRLIAAAVIGTGWLCVELGLVEAVFHGLETGARSSGQFLSANPVIVFWMVWASSLALFLWTRHGAPAFFLGVTTIWLAAWHAPGGPASYIPEIASAFFTLLTAHYAFYTPENRKDTYTAAVVSVLIITIRFWLTPGWGAAAFLIMTAGLIMAIGFFSRIHGLVRVAYAPMAALAIYPIRSAPAYLFGPLGVVLAAFLIFGAGVYTTFRKERLLSALNSEAAQAAAPSPDPDDDNDVVL